MKKITVLSGKGGVGKSSVTASLAVILSRSKKIVCADCDVDASNLSLVLGADNYEEWNDLSTNEEASFDHDKCSSCGKCADACYFNAIRMVDGKPKLKEFSCEGCGACELVCPEIAITLQKINNAKIGYAKTKYEFLVVSSQLEPGNSGSGKVVAEVRKKAQKMADDSDIMLIDSAAGIGCPVIASVTGTDYAIIVTEPTVSGFSDMKKAFEIVKHFRTKAGLVINKYDINSKHCSIIENFAKENDIELLAKIPFDKNFAKALTEMVPIVEYDSRYENLFRDLGEKVLGRFGDIEKEI